MRFKLIISAFIFLIAGFMSSCKTADDPKPDNSKEEENPEEEGENSEEEEENSEEEDVNATHYIRFLIDDTEISFTENVSAERSRSDNDYQQATYIGGNQGENSQNIYIFYDSGFIGVSPGANISMDEDNYPSFIFNYTDDSGVLYSSRYTDSDTEEMHVFVQTVSYEEGGDISGRFSGTIRSENGDALEIKSGEYNLKFKN